MPTVFLASQAEIEQVCGDVGVGNRGALAALLRRIEKPGNVVVANGLGLSAPKVRLLPFRVSDGARIVPALTRVGEAAFARGTLQVSIEGCPPALRDDPTLYGTLELVRYLPKRKITKSVPGGGRKVVSNGQGFVHPCNKPPRPGIPPSATRGGDGGLDIPGSRTTEWSLTGLPFASKISIGVEELALYFRLRDVADNTGAVVTSVLAYLTKRKSRNPNGVWSYSWNPLAGVFAFRFAYFDVTANEWVTGPLSDPVFARPSRWPVFDRVEDTLSPAYPRLKQTVPGRIPNPDDFRTLVCSVGGRVTGKPT